MSADLVGVGPSIGVDTVVSDDAVVSISGLGRLVTVGGAGEVRTFDVKLGQPGPVFTEPDGCAVGAPVTVSAGAAVYFAVDIAGCRLTARQLPPATEPGQ